MNLEAVNSFIKLFEPDPLTRILFCEVKLASPEIILTPCLAFDMTGFRLGYGGGYYDKTITYLKKKKQRYF